MPPQLETAWGYQGNPMALPVTDVTKAVPFYERVMGFEVVFSAVRSASQ